MCGLHSGLHQFVDPFAALDEARETARRDQLRRAEELFQGMCERGEIFALPVTKALSMNDFLEVV